MESSRNGDQINKFQLSMSIRFLVNRVKDSSQSIAISSKTSMFLQIGLKKTFIKTVPTSRQYSLKCEVQGKSSRICSLNIYFCLNWQTLVKEHVML